MKTLFKSALIIAAIAMAFSACNRVDVETPQTVDVETPQTEEDFYYTFILGDPATRSLLSSDEKGKFGAWENGDRLGTAIDDGNPGYAYVTTTTSPTTFKIYKKGGLAGGETVYAYYPYNSTASDVAEIPFEIPAGQNQNGDSFDFDAMPMVAEGYVVPESYASTENNTEIGEISLVNLGSVIDFQIFSSNATYAEETILNVKFSASGAIAGEFTKDITVVKTSNESTLAISGFSGTEVTTTVASASTLGAARSEAAHVYMVVAPVSGITGTVTVTTNKAVYTYNMATAQTFKRAGLKSFGLDLGTCQNRVADETNMTTFVFNTTEGIQALGIELPGTGTGTNVERVVSDCIVLTGETGTSTYYPRVWNSNGNYNFRVNKNNLITFSISEGTIKGISFEATAFYLSTEEGTLTGTTWEGSASSITFVNSNDGRTDINTITVSYTGGVAPIEPVTLVMSDITCDDAEENENSLTFSWTAVENAEGYQVSIDGGNTYGETQTALSYTWEGLNAGRQYTIFVKAVGDGTSYLTSEAKSQTGKTKASESGESSVVYTLNPVNGSNNSYAGNCDVVIDGITWNVTGNSQMQPWRLGGKSLTNVDRAIYSKTALDYNIEKIEITHGAASGITVNSMTVIVATDDEFNNVVSTLTPTFEADATVTVERPSGADWSNCYYKIVYNVTVSGSSNKFLEFTKAVFTGK